MRGNCAVDLGTLQRWKVFVNGFRRMPLIERVHYGIERNSCPGYVVSTVALFDVCDLYGLAPASIMREQINRGCDVSVPHVEQCLGALRQREGLAVVLRFCYA